MFFCIREPSRPGRRARRDAGGGKDTRPAALVAALLAGAPGAGVAADAAPDLAPPPPVAVASSLRFAWPVLLELAHGTDGATPDAPLARTSFGASLTLAGQMLAGAPFELLVAADIDSVARLVSGGLVDPGDVARYADGRLALAVRTDSPLAPVPSLKGLAALLDERPGTRLAIAHPERAPYGRAALEALDAAGLDGLGPARIARGENAGQALQYLLAGAVDAALVPQALVAGAPEGTALAAALVDASLHAPIEHALATVRGAGAPARRLARFLVSCAARDALDAQGFDAPGDAACPAGR